MVEPYQHAISGNREFLMAPGKDDGRYLGVEVDGNPVEEWVYFPSEDAAKDAAEQWLRGKSS